MFLPANHGKLINSPKSGQIRDSKCKKAPKFKKHRSDTDDIPHPYALQNWRSKRAPSEKKNLDPFEVDDSNSSIRNMGNFYYAI